MKLYSSRIELQIIRTICKNNKISLHLLQAVDNRMFHTMAAKNAMVRIKSLLKKDGSIPSWNIIKEDPILSEYREKYDRFKLKILDEENVKDAIRLLKTYYGLREYINLANKIVEEAKSDSVDIEKLSSKVNENINRIQLGGIKSDIWKFGTGDNTKDIIKEVVENKGIEGIPTRFKNWDKMNGKIPNTAVMLIGGMTGGGKSLMAATMCKNMAYGGDLPCLVSLEMSVHEMAARLLASIAEVPIHVIMQGKESLENHGLYLHDNDKERYQSWKTELKLKKEINSKNITAAIIKKKYNDWKKEARGSYRLFESEAPLDMTQTLYSIKSYIPDTNCIIIDYIALLEGVSGDNDWRKLAEAVREAKVFAVKNKIPVIVLAQLGADEELRYSKRMKDHADIAWFWKANREDRDKEITTVTINQHKARNMNPASFKLDIHWKYMKIKDHEESEQEIIENKQERKPPTDKSMLNKKSSKKSKGFDLKDLDG